METPLPTSSWPRLRASVAVVLVTGFAFFWLGATRDPPCTHLDTARDWLQARDCLAQGCPSWGPVASVLHLRQGALWLRFLSTGLALGLDASALQRCLEALQALGAGVVAWGAWRFGRRSVSAALLSVVYVVLLRAIEPGDLLWNPAIAHPGAALFAVGWLGLAAGGGLGFAVLAAAGTALAVLGHVLGLIVLPLLALALATARPHPLTALTVGLSTFVGLVLLDSWDAAVVDVNLLATNGYGALILLATLGAAGAGLLLRRRWSGLSDRLRLGLSLALALLLALLAPVVIPGIVQVAEGSRFAYLVPAFAAMALALGVDALLLRLPTRARVALAALVALLTLGGSHASWRSRDHAGPDAPWRLPEIERLAADVYGRGATYAELFRRVQGPWDSYVVGTLAGLDPNPAPADDDPGPDRALLVLRLAKATVPDPLPTGWRRVDVSPGYAALLLDAEGGVASVGLQRCSPDAEGTHRCATFERRWHENREHPPSFSDRLYPRVTNDSKCAQGTSTARWSLPLEAASVTRRVRLVAPRWEGVAWKLVGASTPAGLERLVEPAEETGRVEVETAGAAPHPARCSPPPILVGPADDPVVRAFLGGRDRT